MTLLFFFSPNSLLSANYVVGYTANVTETSIEDALFFGLDNQDFIVHQGIDFLFACKDS